MTVKLEHDVKFVLRVFALDRSEPDFDRHLLASVVHFHGIRHFGTHGNDGVAINRKNCVDKVVLNLACLVPRGIVVFAALLGDFRFDVKHTALVVPRVRKAVHNRHTVRTDRLCR